MNGDQYREAVSESRRRLAAHQQAEEAVAESGRAIEQFVTGVHQGLAAMSAAVRNAQLGLSQMTLAAGWEWGPDAYHHGPEDEGNDHHE